MDSWFQFSLTPSSWIPVIQFILGFGVLRIKAFNIDEDSYTKKRTELKEIKRENLAMILASIFERKENSDISLRGETGESEDLLYKFSKTVLKNSSLISTLDREFAQFNFLYQGLFYLSWIGLVIFVLMTFFSISQSMLVNITVSLVIVEVILMLLLRRLVVRLNKLFEHD